MTPLEHKPAELQGQIGITIYQPPRYVGGWQIGGNTGLRVNVTKRPRWLTRFLLRHLLEWEWVDGSAA